MSWYHSVGTRVGLWAVVLGILLTLSCSSPIIGFIGLGLLATYLTDWVSKAALNYMPRHNIQDTKDKGVFITGCDSGFGSKLALELDNLGFKVYAGCLFPDGEGAIDLLKNSKRLKVIKLDVTKQDEIEEAYEFVEKDLIGDEFLWAVVNNAGIAAVTEIEFCPIEAYRKLLDVNALGLIRVTKCFLPMLRKSPGSRIVIVASLAGRHTFPGFSAYSMSKHAAVSFADALRMEMDKWEISVHTIEPTLYRTKISNEGVMQNALDKYWEQSPDKVKQSYGQEYLQDFKSTVSEHLSRAKPEEKIQEVIDDMIDSVAGTAPKTRYVPNVVTQIRDRLLSGMPTEMRDSILLKNQPQTPPADISAKRPPPLIDPRIGRIKGPGGSFLKRLYSMPITEKTPFTPGLETIEDEVKFKF